jgi:DNA replication and repair protein RecF
LSFTKSYFTGTDANNVQYGSSGFRIEGNFEKGTETYQTCIILRENGKKEVSCNLEQYEKFSQHIGLFPSVMIAPDDVELIIGGSELRRKFLDTILSQINATYLQQLIIYNKILQQRNSYLKSSSQTQTRNESLLQVLDEQIVSAGNFIYDVRKQFLPPFFQKAIDFYKTIAGATEVIDLRYQSQLEETGFAELLIRNREKDYLLQRSNSGTHKDDLVFNLNKQVFKSAASQGQRKSLLFSLKLAEAETLKEQKGFAPILLLDDVFEKLDAERMHNLLDYVCYQNGQVFLTDTHEERIVSTFEALNKEVQVIRL